MIKIFFCLIERYLLPYQRLYIFSSKVQEAIYCRFIRLMFIAQVNNVSNHTGGTNAEYYGKTFSKSGREIKSFLML